MSGSAPRTLAEQLRGWSEADLTALLVARPDLASPAPQDSAQLATRAGTRASVLRALDQLTMLELAVLEAVVASGGVCARATVLAAVRADRDSTLAAVERLRALALLWGGPDEVRTLSVVAETLGASPSGLGPPAAALLAGYGPARVAALVADIGLTPTGDRSRDLESLVVALADRRTVARLAGQVSAPARAVLDHLERTGSEGTFDGAAHLVRVADAAAPAEELLARGLLLARGRTHVAVPREVSIALRDGRTTREPVDRPPELAVADRGARMVDQAAAGAAYELVRHVELLLEHWGVRPPPALRQGGLGVRELKGTAAYLQVTEAVAALVVEVASAAGLLARGETDELDGAWLPTDAFDGFVAAPPEDRWARLALAWLHLPRFTALVGTRDAGKPVNALQPDLERSWLADTRREALTELAALDPGCVLAAGTGVGSLVARMRWLRPRRPPSRADAVAAALEEGAVVGVLGLGGMSVHGRALLADDPAHEAAAALRPLLPAPVDHVLVQADLTAVAPGPLEQELARSLAAVADIESRGGATVYRFTESSVRRAFDAGWSAVEVHDLLGRASATAVPQPLSYLVDDVARTFGTVRLGAASAFLRSDDETALAALAHDPAAASLRLRRLAPTVLVTDVPVDLLLARLRDLGQAPVLESADGTVRLGRHPAYRARTPTQPPADPRDRTRAQARAAATATAVRAGDRAAANRPSDLGPPARATPAATLAVLREAAEHGGTVWIGYVDNDGSTLERVVDPHRVEGGWLRAFDHRTNGVRSFAVHRITAVRPLSR
jgi:hypothetical protein